MKRRWFFKVLRLRLSIIFWFSPLCWIPNYQVEEWQSSSLKFSLLRENIIACATTRILNFVLIKKGIFE